jgi:hypothetical protein
MRIAIVPTLSLAATILVLAGREVGAQGSAPLTISPTPPECRQSMATANASLGPVVGAPPAPIHYADNSAASPRIFIDIERIPAIVGLDRPGTPLQLESIVLMKWLQTRIFATGARIPSIDPSRMVYEVTTRFDSSYSVRGNQFPAGNRVFVIDAVCGTVHIDSTSEISRAQGAGS